MNQRYVIAISFANYLKDKTGISKVMMAHQQMYNNAGISYVSLYSVKKNICHDKFMLFCMFGLIIDGEYKGIYQMSQLTHMFYDWQGKDHDLIDLHIHHMMYMKINLVKDLLGSCQDTPVKIYFHDYYIACAGYNLMKNREDFCGGTGHSDECCNGCKHYKADMKFRKELRALLKENVNRIAFISPSRTTRNIFANFYPEYKDQTIVIPHQKFDARYMENLNPVEKDEKINIAYLGMPQKHKGWETWQRLVKSVPKDQFTFTVFNSSDDTYSEMKKVKIAFNKENLNAMTDALRSYQVHIAVLWSICPETYSYTCFEAYSANAFIITNPNSGNIADVVKQNGCGVVLSNEQKLIELFSNVDELIKIVNQYRMTSPGGPLQLYENDEIVRISICNDKHHNIRVINKFVNYLLLWLLNKICR